MLEIIFAFIMEVIFVVVGVIIITWEGGEPPHE